MAWWSKVWNSIPNINRFVNERYFLAIRHTIRWNTISIVLYKEYMLAEFNTSILILVFWNVYIIPNSMNIYGNELLNMNKSYKLKV